MYGPDFYENIGRELGLPNAYGVEVTKLEGGEYKDFANPPVRTLIEFSSDFTNPVLVDEITRYSILNRKVEFFVATRTLEDVLDKDGKPVVEKGENKKKVVIGDYTSIGSIVFNSMDTAWEGFTVLTDHPMALKALQDTCAAYHLKNLYPLQK